MSYITPRNVGRLLLCVALSYALVSAMLYGDSTLWYRTLSALNLVLHELGHMLTMPFGKTLHILGGTLFQWSSPLMLMLVCLWNREHLGAATMLFWLGQSMHDEVPYIADAMALKLDLFGGSIHDWNYLLFHFNVLQHYAVIAQGVQYIGIGLMAAGVITSWALLIRYSRNAP